MRFLPALLLVLACLVPPVGARAGALEDAAAAYSIKDYATALSVWRPLAALGNPAAQFNLGLMYDNGHGVPQDYAGAVKWYAMAALQGDAQAQYNLGYLYDSGLGTARDPAEAVRWYRMAAQQGDPRAQSLLGLMYAGGQGVAQDLVKAHVWFDLALMSADSESASKNREVISRQMSPEDIGRAQELARACRARKYEGCD